MVVPGNHTDDPPTSGDPAQYTQSDVDKAVSSAVENTISSIEIKLFEVLTNPASLDEGEWLPLRDAILEHALPFLMHETLSAYASCQVDLQEAQTQITDLEARIRELEDTSTRLSMTLDIPADWNSKARNDLKLAARQRLTTRTADKAEGLVQPAILETESNVTSHFLNLPLYEKSNLLTNKERDKLKMMYPPLENQSPDAPAQKSIPSAKLSEARIMKSNMEQWLRGLFIFQQGMDGLLHQNWTATLRCFTHLYIYMHNVLAHQFFKRVEVEATACGADPEESVLQNVSHKQTLPTYEERESFRKRKREETDRKLQQQILHQLIKQKSESIASTSRTK